ncbi:hypothetical protein ABK040_009514 [Willaertia magna]
MSESQMQEEDSGETFNLNALKKLLLQNFTIKHNITNEALELDSKFIDLMLDEILERTIIIAKSQQSLINTTTNTEMEEGEEEENKPFIITKVVNQHLEQVIGQIMTEF